MHLNPKLANQQLMWAKTMQRALSFLDIIWYVQGLPVAEYERRKEEAADAIIERIEAALPGRPRLRKATIFREVLIAPTY